MITLSYRNKNYFAYFFIVTFCFLFQHNTLVAQDFDINRDKVPDILFSRSNTATQVLLRYRSIKSSRLGNAGRAGTGESLPFIYGFNDKKPKFGFVKKNSNNSITWNLIGNTGEKNIDFGSTNQLLLSGVNLVGQSNFDLISLSIESGLIKWNIIPDPEVNDTPIQESHILGIKSDTPFILTSLESTRDNIKNLAAVANIQDNGTTVIYYRDIPNAASGTITLNKTFTQIERPFSIFYKNTPSLVIPVRVGNTTQFNIFNYSGTFLKTVTINRTGIIISGNYQNIAASDDFGIWSSNNLFLSNSDQRRTVTLRIIGNQIIQKVMYNIFGEFEDPNDPTCKIADSTDGFKTGFIWKPNSDTQRFAVVVMPGNIGKITKVFALKKDYSVIKEILTKGCGNPDKTGVRCAFQDKTYTGQQYRALFGSIIIKAEISGGRCLYYPIDNPATRTD
jgi:hypothetical protein